MLLLLWIFYSITIVWLIWIGIDKYILPFLSRLLWLLYVCSFLSFPFWFHKITKMNNFYFIMIFSKIFALLFVVVLLLLCLLQYFSIFFNCLLTLHHFCLCFIPFQLKNRMFCFSNALFSYLMIFTTIKKPIVMQIFSEFLFELQRKMIHFFLHRFCFEQNIS